MSANHTPTPWELGEFDEQLGYDCMTGGIQIGKAYLDGAQYGQKRCDFPMPADQKAQMLADAVFIHRAVNSHDALVEALEEIIKIADDFTAKHNTPEAECITSARSALALAKGESQAEAV